MGVQPCGDLQQQALLILKTWAKKVKENLGFDKLLVFGSLVRRPENGFGRQEGDVDLLIVWGKNHVSPKQRLEFANKLVDKQLELENLFKRNIFNHPRRQRFNCINTELFDDFDLSCNAYRGKEASFFGNDFVDLTEVGNDRLGLRVEANDRFRERYSELFSQLAICQTFQSKYVVANELGKPGPVYDVGPGTTFFGIPKIICRVSRVARVFSGGYGSQNITDAADAFAGHADARVIFNNMAKQWGGRLAEISICMNETTEELTHINWTREDLFLMFEALACHIRQALRSEIETIESGRIKTREKHMLEKFCEGSIKLQDFDTKCQLFPKNALTDEIYKVGFQESDESFNRIKLVWSSGLIATNTTKKIQNELLSSIESESDVVKKDIYSQVQKIMKRGDSRYPRMTAVPRLTSDSTGKETALEISLSQGAYHLALAAERLPDLEAIRQIKSEYNLNSLAVRVGYIYQENQIWYVEFQQRSERNATYQMAWDVAAAGYLDPDRHADPDDDSGVVLSIVQAARREISEEMKIPLEDVPYKEDFHFFGVTRNINTGQLDVLGYCIAKQARDRVASSGKSEYVHTFSRCELQQEKLIAFILEKRYWVPTAILNLLLICLHHARRSGRTELEGLFDAFSKLDGKVCLSP